jgi:hypothetical protein
VRAFTNSPLTALELCALRLTLARRLTREPLDGLLVSLTPSVCSPAPTLDFASLRRALLLAERGVARMPWVPRTCLYKALARYAFLRKRGVDISFVLGLDSAASDAATGHAWVELGGAPFEEVEDVGKYVVTFRFPAPAAGAERGTN